MQIASVPPPIVTNNALPQDVAAKAVPNMQATAPLIQNSVAPSPKSEKFGKDRDQKGRNRDRNDERGKEGDDKEEHSVNIRV
jgi:hypothetical protein